MRSEINLLLRDGAATPNVRLSQSVQEALSALRGHGLSERELVDRISAAEGPAALAFLMRPDSSSGLSTDETSAFGSLLVAYEILVDNSEDEGPAAFWEFHNLLFHARSRIGRHLGSYGGTYPLRGRFEPLPAN